MKRPKRIACNGISRRALLAGAAATAVASSNSHADEAEQAIRVGYVRWVEPHPTILLADKPAANNGLAGAKLGIDDNNTTGRFLGQSFTLTDVPVRQSDDAVASVKGLLATGVKLVLSDVPADRLLAMSAVAQDGLLFNVGAEDDALRNQDCRANVIHTAPSHAMLTDAVAQYLVWKKWTRWFLVYGSHNNDAALADDYRRSAKRFGARIVGERIYKDTGESRQTDSGLIQIQQQMPVFTQNAPDYDVLIAADENEVFAGYLPYRTWDPRPVVGSAGLRPASWDANSEAWGGTQLQDRFTRLFHRPMTSLDMQAWTAARIVGEAASRTHSDDAAKISAWVHSPQFEVAAYKGQKLTLRDWDWQLRQPILLTDGRGVVSISPQPGFLHQVTELDTLGYDRPETKCVLK